LFFGFKGVVPRRAQMFDHLPPQGLDVGGAAGPLPGSPRCRRYVSDVVVDVSRLELDSVLSQGEPQDRGYGKAT
jgi:hypothetical protein